MEETTEQATSQPIKEIADWRNALFADNLADVLRDVYEHCARLTDDELAILAEQAKQPSDSNCYWAIYEVAKRVRAEVSVVQRARKHAAESAS